MAGPRFVAVGELTRVRAFTRRDVDRWLAWPSHADPLYAIYDPLPMDGSLRDAWYDDLVHRQGQLPFAVETYDRQMIGRLFLRHVRRSEGSSVLGIDLDPRFVGRGHGTDALGAFLGYYFGPAGFSRLLLSVAAYNVRARRSYRRCGFRERATHWERWQVDVDVLGDPRYAELRQVFRRGPRGVEALMYDMVAERAVEASGGSPACWRSGGDASAREAALGPPTC
jgi:diamine N-acetyltransferase